VDVVLPVFRREFVEHIRAKNPVERYDLAKLRESRPRYELRPVGTRLGIEALDGRVDDRSHVIVTVPSGLFEVKGHANYRLIVVADCCADPDPEVHRVLLEKVFARPATVTTAEAIIGALA
jgi:hypothetical protein